MGALYFCDHKKKFFLPKKFSPLAERIRQLLRLQLQDTLSLHLQMTTSPSLLPLISPPFLLLFLFRTGIFYFEKKISCNREHRYGRLLVDASKCVLLIISSNKHKFNEEERREGREERGMASNVVLPVIYPGQWSG